MNSSYNEKMEALETRLEETTDFEERMNLLGDIVDLKIEYGIIRLNSEGPIECIGCGS